MPTTREERREQRAEEAKHHLATMNTVFSSETEESIASTRIYEDGEGRDLEIPEASHEQTDISIAAHNATSALYGCRGSVAILDFASFRYPGGSYERGGFSQEEALCSESNLYPILLGMKDAYYEKNKHYMRGSLFTDRAMYIKDVRFARHGDIRKADVIVCAAPNRKEALERVRSEEECDADLARRIETVMHIAAANGCDTLILGAFGCGLPGNDPQMVATLFKTWLDEHPGVFASVIFAIPPSPSLDVFREVFDIEDPRKAAREARVEKTVEEDDEEDSWRDIDLPEGITIG